jgi:diguanylate cyclase (GGDEF)-like protein
MTERIPLVLVAEDEMEVASLLEVILRREGHHVLVARSAPAATALAKAHHPDLILLDLGLPGGSGTEVCDAVRADPAMADIPILIVSAENATDSLVSGLEHGAADYIRKPFDPIELVARVRAAMRTKLRFDALQERTNALTEMAFVDELTGLYNRRRMIERLEEEYKRARRYAYPISCLFVDIDYFKSINDDFGHQAGDDVLREVSSLLRGCIRAYDVACRYGGEEFVVLLPQTDTEQALVAAERIRATVEGMTCSFGDRPVTVSIGIATYPETAQDPDSLLTRADRAMYQAKETGRNRIASASPTPATP